ncbi:MAG: PIN domain-containing protein [Oscillospiraceae bacterium]|jgi:predicted nucleic-acid-binding protein|nr:PIN domain-containing protein [Oscillospiraceae bacterium]
MKKNGVILDTNAVLRYLLKDNIEQAKQVGELIKQDFNFLILPEVIAEVIYVMTKNYSLDRVTVANILLKFISIFEYNVILNKALTIYKATKLDFVDCVLCAYSNKYEVFTFDKDLKKFINKTTS